MHQGTPHSPVDDETYDLLQTLTSKLEALETYSKYEPDTQGDAKQALQEIAEQDRQHAERLVGLLAGRLGNGSMSESGGSMSGSDGSMSGSTGSMSGSSGSMSGSAGSSMGQGTASAGD